MQPRGARVERGRVRAAEVGGELLPRTRAPADRYRSNRSGASRRPRRSRPRAAGDCRRRGIRRERPRGVFELSSTVTRSFLQGRQACARRRHIKSALLSQLAVLPEDEHRGQHDLEVEPHRPVLEVVVVPLDSIRKGGLSPETVDLRPAGDARLDAVTIPVPGDRALEDLDELRPLGRGPIRLMSPLTTLISCGNSSSDSRRTMLPKRVRRSAPSTPPGATFIISISSSDGASAGVVFVIVLNL